MGTETAVAIEDAAPAPRTRSRLRSRKLDSNARGRRRSARAAAAAPVPEEPRPPDESRNAIGIKQEQLTEQENTGALEEEEEEQCADDEAAPMEVDNGAGSEGSISTTLTGSAEAFGGAEGEVPGVAAALDSPPHRSVQPEEQKAVRGNGACQQMPDGRRPEKSPEAQRERANSDNSQVQQEKIAKTSGEEQDGTGAGGDVPAVAEGQGTPEGSSRNLHRQAVDEAKDAQGRLEEHEEGMVGVEASGKGQSALAEQRRGSAGGDEHGEESAGSGGHAEVDIEGYIVFIPSLLRYGCVPCGRAGMNAKSAAMHFLRSHKPDGSVKEYEVYCAHAKYMAMDAISDRLQCAQDSTDEPANERAEKGAKDSKEEEQDNSAMEVEHVVKERDADGADAGGDSNTASSRTGFQNNDTDDMDIERDRDASSHGDSAGAGHSSGTRERRKADGTEEAKEQPNDAPRPIAPIDAVRSLRGVRCTIGNCSAVYHQKKSLNVHWSSVHPRPGQGRMKRTGHFEEVHVQWLQGRWVWVSRPSKANDLQRQWVVLTKMRRKRSSIVNAVEQNVIQSCPPGDVEATVLKQEGGVVQKKRTRRRTRAAEPLREEVAAEVRKLLAWCEAERRVGCRTCGTLMTTRSAHPHLRSHGVDVTFRSLELMVKEMRAAAAPAEQRSFEPSSTPLEPVPEMRTIAAFMCPANSCIYASRREDVLWKHVLQSHGESAITPNDVVVGRFQRSGNRLVMVKGFSAYDRKVLGREIDGSMRSGVRVAVTDDGTVKTEGGPGKAGEEPGSGQGRGRPSDRYMDRYERAEALIQMKRDIVWCESVGRLGCTRCATLLDRNDVIAHVWKHGTPINASDAVAYIDTLMAAASHTGTRREFQGQRDAPVEAVPELQCISALRCTVPGCGFLTRSKDLQLHNKQCHPDSSDREVHGVEVAVQRAENGTYVWVKDSERSGPHESTEALNGVNLDAAPVGTTAVVGPVSASEEEVATERSAGDVQAAGVEGGAEGKVKAARPQIEGEEVGRAGAQEEDSCKGSSTGQSRTAAAISPAKSAAGEREVDKLASLIVLIPSMSTVGCVACCSTVHPKQVKAHLRAHHSLELPDPVVDKFVASLLSDCTSIPRLYYPRETAQPVVHELRTMEGFRCSVRGCPAVLRSVLSIKKHCEIVHGGVLVPRGKEVRVQKFNNRFVCVTGFSRADKVIYPHVVPAPDEQASADGEDESNLDVEPVPGDRMDSGTGGGSSTGSEDVKSEAVTARGWEQQQLEESRKMPCIDLPPSSLHLNAMAGEIGDGWLEHAVSPMSHDTTPCSTKTAVTVPQSAVVVDSNVAPREIDVPDAPRGSQGTAIGEKRSASPLPRARKRRAVESAATGPGVEISAQPREVVEDASNEEQGCEAGGGALRDRTGEEMAPSPTTRGRKISHRSTSHDDFAEGGERSKQHEHTNRGSRERRVRRSERAARTYSPRPHQQPESWREEARFAEADACEDGPLGSFGVDDDDDDEMDVPIRTYPLSPTYESTRVRDRQRSSSTAAQVNQRTTRTRAAQQKRRDVRHEPAQPWSRARWLESHGGGAVRSSSPSVRGVARPRSGKRTDSSDLRLQDVIGSLDRLQYLLS